MSNEAFEARLAQTCGRYRKSGKEYLVHCPFCEKNGLRYTRKFKLSFNPELGKYKCWRCNEAGGIDWFFRSRGVASVQGVGKGVGFVKTPPLPKNPRSPGMMTPMANLLDKPDHPACQYLLSGRGGKSRKVDPSELTPFGTMYCKTGTVFGDKKDFQFDASNTLVFPIYFKGDVVGWQCRLLYEPEDVPEEFLIERGYPRDEDGEVLRPPKYFTSPGFPKGRVFFNWDIAIKEDMLVVVEGVFDAVSVGKCAIAALGKNLDEAQVSLLANAGKPIVLLLDPDAAAESQELANYLSGRVPVTVVTLPDNVDAGDLTHDEVWGFISSQIEEDYAKHLQENAT